MEEFSNGVLVVLKRMGHGMGMASSRGSSQTAVNACLLVRNLHHDVPLLHWQKIVFAL